MNDPGLDQSVNQAAQAWDPDPFRDLEEEEEEEVENFLDPSRWWFASTAIPLLAGTFGPMANAFSICALVQSWRLYIPPGQTEAQGQHIKDPAWVTGINATSLGLALIANFALLLNMARRLSFEVAQGITIVGFFVAGCLLVGLLGAASSSSFRIDPPQTHSLSQAFYYGIFAAALYIIISLLMVITVYGALAGHYDKEFQLSVAQRTLMLQTIMFMMYLLLGACVYTYVESWQYLDAVYFADFTLLTIGIGTPFTPTTHLGRSLLFPFAMGGIITVGLVVGSVRSMVLERGKAKMDARMTEKRRERVLTSINETKRTVQASRFKKMRFDQTGLSEFQRREQEFHLMRKIQKDSNNERKYMSLAMSVLAACLLWFIGALVFWYSERPQEWSYFVALYFSFTSLLTIGYGDFQPNSCSGRAFFVFWTLMAVPTLTILISNMGDTVVKGFSDATNWVGSVTVLPGEGGFRASVKATIENAYLRASITDKHWIEQPPGYKMDRTDTENNEHSKKRHHHITQMTMKRVAKHLEDEELREATQAEREGDMLERDVHFYHYVLSRELRQLMIDVNASPPKRYDFEEWSYYLKLIGQDEADPEMHKKPLVKPPQHRKTGALDQHGTKLGDASGLPPSSSDADSPPSTGADSADPSTDPHISADGGAQNEVDLWTKYKRQWSWLGPRSPLMGQKSEAEWLLEHVSAVLEFELKRSGISKGMKRPPGRPPISMTELVRDMWKKERATTKREDEEKQENGE